MSKEQALQERYFNKYGSYYISHDKTGDTPLVYIYTERFVSTSLISEESSFNKYEPSIQQLYNVTYGDAKVMEKNFANGKIRTLGEFEEAVNRNSFMWKHNNPFACFIITDKENDNVVGYEVIRNTNIEHEPIPNTAKIGYALNTAYQRNNDQGIVIKGAGSELVGALVLGYGSELLNRYVNTVYNNETNQFEGGTVFQHIIGSVRTDNIPSKKILLNLGFNYVTEEDELGYTWAEYQKNYVKDSQETSLSGEEVVYTE